jgi:hypothetical protein
VQTGIGSGATEEHVMAQFPPPDDVTTPVQYENLTYSNPRRQTVHPRWAGGTVVWSIPCGRVPVDPNMTRVADEHIVVYSMDGDGGKPEKVVGQYTIYDTKPGDPGYSPLWRHNYVIVPRDYQLQTLRSKDDVLRSGYAIVPTDEVTN